MDVKIHGRPGTYGVRRNTHHDSVPGLLTCYFRCEYYKDVPDSFAAFKIVADFCSSHNMVTACVVALAIVMMLTSPEGIPLRLEPSGNSFEPRPTSRARDKRCGRLLNSIDKCMSLSCCLQGIESLLGSAFFDPRIPCNLLGAQRVALDNALRLPEDDFAKFAISIARRSPQVAILWLATVWGGRGRAVLDMVTSAMPSIDFLVAAWTGSIQSFTQVKYCPTFDRPGIITRAFEFSTSVFARPELNNPRVASPPFGLSLISNTGLEVRQHLEHDHRPRRARLRLVSDSGELLPASEPWISMEITWQKALDNVDARPGKKETWSLQSADRSINIPAMTV